MQASLPVELIGYGDRLSVAADDVIAFKVSTDHPHYEAAIVRLIHGDTNGPGFKADIVETPWQQAGRKQIAHAGSYLRVEPHRMPVLSGSLSIQMWIYPTTPFKGVVQGLLSRWSSDGGFALVIGESGDLGLWIGDGQQVERISTGSPLRPREWYFVAATLDAETGSVRLVQRPLARWPLEASSVVVNRTVGIVPSRNDAPLLIAALAPKTADHQRAGASGLYNGKIDRPCLFARALDAEQIERLRQDAAPEDVAANDLIAAWDFSADSASAKISDGGRHHLDGVAVNMPMRAVTGHNWNATEYDFTRAPSHYGAIHFHDDDLEDAGWETDFQWTVPPTARSGFYAARLRAGEQEDYIPFFVRPRRGTSSAEAVILVPTLTYLAYANDRMKSFPIHAAGITNRRIVKDPLDVYLEAHPEFAMSIYDLHADGSGCAYSSRLRPIVTMRPNYRMWLIGGPRQLAADLYLVDWLEHEGIAYDVITDEDLHAEGESLLGRYRVVLSGTHPEYWTSAMLAALEGYLAGGGRLMSLGANGYYWVTAIDAERPHVVEVRRGNAGTRAWNSAPGEQYHSATGELGGLWRHRGKTPNQIAGVGFTGMGWDAPTPGYTRQPGSFDERARFIFEGIADDEVIGNFGLVLGGAAGDELDRLDYDLGSPPHTLLLASATGYNRAYLPVIEDVLEISASLIAAQDPHVRADMVYFETPNDGAVFSTGSITWCASLSHNAYVNNVSRITGNVLKHFLSEGR